MPDPGDSAQPNAQYDRSVPAQVTRSTAGKGLSATDTPSERYRRPATAVAGRADGPAGASVTIADPGGAQVALFKPHAGQR